MKTLDQRLIDARAEWDAHLKNWEVAEWLADQAREVAESAEAECAKAKRLAHEAACRWAAITNAIAVRDAELAQKARSQNLPVNRLATEEALGWARHDECVQCGAEARTHEGSCVKCK